MKIGRFLGKPSAAAMAALNWQPKEQQPELWLQAYIAPDSAWGERLINMDWINSPFRSGGSVGFTALWRDQALQPRERLEIPLGVKQGLSRQIAPDNDESTPALIDKSNACAIDLRNARSVVEAHVAAALAGDVSKASALAKNSPADPKHIRELPEFLNVQRLKIERVSSMIRRLSG